MVSSWLEIRAGAVGPKLVAAAHPLSLAGCIDWRGTFVESGFGAGKLCPGGRCSEMIPVVDSSTRRKALGRELQAGAQFTAFSGFKVAVGQGSRHAQARCFVAASEPPPSEMPAAGCCRQSPALNSFLAPNPVLSAGRGIADVDTVAGFWNTPPAGHSPHAENPPGGGGRWARSRHNRARDRMAQAALIVTPGSSKNSQLQANFECWLPPKVAV